MLQTHAPNTFYANSPILFVQVFYCSVKMCFSKYFISYFVNSIDFELKVLFILNYFVYVYHWMQNLAHQANINIYEHLFSVM